MYSLLLLAVDVEMYVCSEETKRVRPEGRALGCFEPEMKMKIRFAPFTQKR